MGGILLFKIALLVSDPEAVMSANKLRRRPLIVIDRAKSSEAALRVASDAFGERVKTAKLDNGGAPSHKALQQLATGQ